MNNNDPYDMSLQWMPQQRQNTERAYRQLPPTYPEGRLRPGYVPRPPQQQNASRMSKVEALERIASLKKYIIVGSLLGFGALSALVATQLNAVATTNSNGPSSQMPAVQDPSAPIAPSDSATGSGGFFHNQGGYGFGSGGSSSAPFTRSHVS